MELIRLSHLVKKSFKVIQLAYFLSFLFFSSFLVFLFFHSNICDFTLLPLFSALEFTIDRNKMFLLCNGILVILVKSSSFSPSSPPQESKMPKENDQIAPLDQQKEFDLGSEKKVVGSDPSEEQSIPDQNASFLAVGGSVSEEKIVVLGSSHDEEEKKEEEEEEEEAEELNKRCEDFIRKMKQIISESRKDPDLPRFS